MEATTKETSTMKSKWNYQAGDIIEYATYGGEVRTVEVDTRITNIKYDEPGFYGTTLEGGEVWGYDRQITALVVTDPTTAVRA